MQFRFKYVFPLLSVVTVIPLLTIYQLNIEKWAETKGFDETFTNGVSLMLDSGWGPWLIVLFLLSVGATGGMWIDAALRKLFHKKPENSAEIEFYFDSEKGQRHARSMRNISNWRYKGNDVFIEFNTPIEKPILSVGSGSKELKWCETFSTSRYVFLNVENIKSDEWFQIHAVTQEKAPCRRQQIVNQKQDGHYISADTKKQLDHFKKNITAHTTKAGLKGFFMRLPKS